MKITSWFTILGLIILFPMVVFAQKTESLYAHNIKPTAACSKASGCLTGDTDFGLSPLDSAWVYVHFSNKVKLTGRTPSKEFKSSSWVTCDSFLQMFSKTNDFSCTNWNPLYEHDVHITQVTA